MMFGKHFARSLKGNLPGRLKPFRCQAQNNAGKGSCGQRLNAARLSLTVRALTSNVTEGLVNMPRVWKIGAGLLLTGGVTTIMLRPTEPNESDFAGLDSSKLAWLEALKLQPGVREVHLPGKVLRTSVAGKLWLEEDHMIEAMITSGQVKEFRCFYDANKMNFHSAVFLGRQVCGYPQTVHGGLTAAIIDESFGGLYTFMLTGGKLGVRFPAYTARLEVDYKRKIPSKAAMLCTAELEGVEKRKIWMRASVTDGEGVEYARARALFVAPKMPNILKKLEHWWISRRGRAAVTADENEA